ncbi:MAG: sulfatase-like hydrolase/transferase [Verrucomicrobiota bacterium]
MILTDDQGYGDMACHGNPWLKTPEMDRLHADSVRLTDFHVDPTCSPTRAALMTGRYATRTGVWLTYGSRHHLRRDEVTMADAFQQSGYKTAIFGKWHLGDNYPFRPSDRGFDESFIHGGGVVGETPDYWDNNYYDDIYFRDNEPEQSQGYCTDLWFSEAISFAEKNKNNPFFIYLSANAPHGPLHVPEKYSLPYAEHGTKRALFYGMIASIDENLGRLRQKLVDLKIDRDTLFIYLNDNGTAGGYNERQKIVNGKKTWTHSGYNAGMRGRKGSAYEGGHRAACFLSWPNGNLTGGRDLHGLTAHFDLMPTLIELCDLEPQPKVNFDGTSLAPSLKLDGPPVPERTLFVHHQGRFGKPIEAGDLIKDKDFAAMKTPWRLVGKELYNLDSDPGQRTNVAANHPKITTELRQAYEAWWNDVTSQADTFCPFVINPDKQRTVMISSQNLLGGEMVAYSQRHVRAAAPAGRWTIIDVEKPGRYRVSLARWPRESKLPISAPPKTYQLAPETHEMFERKDQALKITSAQLQIGDVQQNIEVQPTDAEVSFIVDLPAGEQRFEASFSDQNEKSYTAYFAYLEPAPTNEVTLFDGKTLTGWTSNAAINWTVQDGIITADSGPIGLLLSEKKYENYELKLEFKAALGSNSGIFLNTEPIVKDEAIDCYEINIAGPSNPFPTGSLVKHVKIEGKGEKDSWRSYHLIVNDGVVSVTLDGEKLYEYVANPRRPAGHIGLQKNLGQIAFRNITLREL